MDNHVSFGNIVFGLASAQHSTGFVGCADYSCDDDDRCEHYEEFAGTYAQDVAGYSDEDIYDAFDGDPEAYWNID